MTEKFLKFTVVETIGRTFEIPMSEVESFLKESSEDTTNWNEVDMADFVYNDISHELIKEYETTSVLSETYIQDEEIE